MAGTFGSIFRYQNVELIIQPFFSRFYGVNKETGTKLIFRSGVFMLYTR